MPHGAQSNRSQPGRSSRIWDSINRPKRRGRDSNPRYRGYPHNSFVVIEADRVCCGKRGFPPVCLGFRGVWVVVGTVLGTREVLYQVPKAV